MMARPTLREIEQLNRAACPMTDADFNLRSFERVDSAYMALIRAGDFMDSADPRAWIRKSNVLLDACIDAGMRHDECDHVLWAGEYVTRALLAA